jgi:hypothetical protein
METVCFTETLVPSYESTRRLNPEEQHHIHRRENLRPPNVEEAHFNSMQPSSLTRHF